MILPLLLMMVMVAVTGPVVMVKNSVGSVKLESTMLNSMQLVCGTLEKNSEVVFWT